MFECGIDKRVQRVLDMDRTVEQKISKLTILALKAFPHSPYQHMIQRVREQLRNESNPK